MQKVISIRVRIEERNGWHMATSDDLPGLILAHTDRKAVIQDLPKAIRLLFSTRNQCECQVFASTFGDQSEDDAPWVVIPPEIASRQPESVRV